MLNGLTCTLPPLALEVTVHPRQEKRLIWKCLSQCPNEASVISWMFWVHNIRPVRAIYRNVDITHYTTVLSLEVPTSNMIEWNAEIYVLRGLCFVTRVFSEVSCLSSSNWERLRATDQLKSPLSSCLTGLNNLHKHDAREVEETENEVKEHKWRWREEETFEPWCSNDRAELKANKYTSWLKRILHHSSRLSKTMSGSSATTVDPALGTALADWAELSNEYVVRFSLR